MSAPSANPLTLKERVRSFFDNLQALAIAMDDASPTNAIFDRLCALEARVERLEQARNPSVSQQHDAH